MKEYIDKSDVNGLVQMGWSGDAIVTAIMNDGISSVPAIPIPEGATNGDVIKAMFPNCEQKENIHNGYFEMYFDNDLKNASYMRVSKDWWNAPYKKEVKE